MSSSHLRALFYLRNCDVLLTTKLQTWQAEKQEEIATGLVLLLLVAKFGMEGYNELKPSFLDSAFNNMPQQPYRCGWQKAYSDISHQNSYSNVVQQMKPNINKSFKTYSSTPSAGADKDDDEFLTLLAKKAKLDI